MAKKKSSKKAPAKKAPAKKVPKKAPPSKISMSEYEKMLGSGYQFGARELNEDAVRANRRANMYMAPGFGLSGKGRVAKGPPPRPINRNSDLRKGR